jgi:hypothetical protein
MLGLTTKGQRLVCGYQNALLLTLKDLRKVGYLKPRPKLVL